MRSGKMNGVGPIDSSFLSCEKDSESILRKLFVDSKPYSDLLKRLLVINTSDCLDDITNPVYIDKIKKMSLAELYNKKYIRLSPKIKIDENEEMKSYIIITFDNFTPNKENPQFRDCLVMIDVICNSDCWDIGNFRQRPLKICGYIDGILNNSRLSGIGTLQFEGCNEIVLSENLSGYCLTYSAIHGSDDRIENEE